MATARTRLVVALGMFNLVRQLVTLWAAQERRRLRHDSPQVRIGRVELTLPRIERVPEPRERLRGLMPVALVLALVGVLVAAARHVARRHPTPDADEERIVTSAVRASSRAIDAGVDKVIEGGNALAVGTASSIAASTAVARQAAVERVRGELDEQVVQPARHKALAYASIGVAALTVYVIVLSVIVQLIVGALG